MTTAFEQKRMTVENHDVLGKLIKTWATGKNYVDPTNKEHYPVPRDLAELKDQLKRAGAGAVIPERITKLQIVMPDMQTLVLRIPPAELILDSEKELQSGGSYRLPAFYSKDAFGGAPAHLPKGEALLDFHAKRIGDYSIANCQ